MKYLSYQIALIMTLIASAICVEYFGRVIASLPAILFYSIVFFSSGMSQEISFVLFNNQRTKRSYRFCISLGICLGILNIVLFLVGTIVFSSAMSIFIAENNDELNIKNLIEFDFVGFVQLGTAVLVNYFGVYLLRTELRS